MTVVTTVPPSTFGIPALRTEDPRFLRGQGRYLENIPIPGALRAVFVRSIFAHATVKQIQGLEEARAMPGVVAVYTSRDLALPHQLAAGSVEVPGGDLDQPFERPVLASERFRYVGEPYGVVIAETAGQAQDAAERIWADVEPLPVVIDAESATATDAPLLFPETGTNVATRFEHHWDDDVLGGAEVIVRRRFVNQRVAPVPMEMNGIAVVPDGDGYTVWVSSQVPFDVRGDLVDVLDVPRAKLRVIAPDVGGGFGAKIPTYPEYVVVAKAAAELRAPRALVRIAERVDGEPDAWARAGAVGRAGRAARRHDHGAPVRGARRRGGLPTTRLVHGADDGRDDLGRLRDPRDRVPWPRGGDERHTARRLSGAGRPEASACIERAIDLLATELTMDPVEVRRRNLIPPDAFPYRTAAGTEYDTGAYAVALDRALELADYDGLRAEQRDRRARGDRTALGIGVATYVEITGFPTKEFARVDVETDGTATVFVGTTSFGTGHETAFAQLAGGMLAIPYTDVRVVHSDTSLVERGQGSWGSRSLQAGGSVIATRTGEVIDRARELAATALEADPVDVVGPIEGGFQVAGAPARTVGWVGACRPRRGRRRAAVGQGGRHGPGRDLPVRCARRRRRRGPRHGRRAGRAADRGR